MKKLGLIVKDTVGSRIKAELKGAKSFFIVTYSKVSSPDMTTLRKALKGPNVTFFVAKNTVARRALKDSGLESMIKFVEGPSGLIFTKDEPVEVSRTLYNFCKEHEQLKIEAGFLQEKILDKKDIEFLAKLPSKEVLRAQVVMALNAPIVQLALVLNGNLRKLVCCLDQIRQKKGTQGTV